MPGKTRIESTYRDTESRDGSISLKIYGKIVKRIKRYCRFMNLNKTKFIIQCVEEKLDELEPKIAESILREKSKDELIQICLSKDEFFI